MGNCGRRILITGTSSIHGWPVFKAIQEKYSVDSVFGIRPPRALLPDGPNVESLCITDRKNLERIRNTFRPTHVIHAAGVCDLDVCEERPEWAARLNIDGAQAVADVFGKTCHILFLSTDLVFSGNHPPAGGYAEHHEPDPVSVAGRTFAAAEKVISSCPDFAIIRLGLPLGDSVTGTKGAIDWVRHRFERGLKVTLFHDELRSCIECDTLAQGVLSHLEKSTHGIVHLGGPEPISLYAMGKRVLAEGQFSPDLLNSISRHDEIDGPPRIGNVALKSQRKPICNSFTTKI